MLGEILVGDGPNFSPLRTRWFTANCFNTGEFDQFLKACLSRQYAANPNGSARGSTFRGLPWIEGQAGYTLYTHSLTPNQLSCVNGGMTQFGAYTLASSHPNGVMTAFADGAVNFVANSIDIHVWRARGSRNRGD
jgi:prepilin-type processing-associated H-X9-DG protein